MMGAKRVLLFGGIGQGKSALVNTLLGSAQARMSDRAAGVTRENDEYHCRHGGTDYCFVDTAGLNEGASGSVAGDESFMALKKLLNDGETSGYNLAIMVHKGRLTEAAFEANYDLFVRTMFESCTLPVVLVKTGCEDNMDGWLQENSSELMRLGYDGFTAVLPGCCAHGSPGGPLEAPYSSLRQRTAAKVWAAVELHALGEPARLQAGSGSLIRMWNRLCTWVRRPDWQLVSTSFLDSLLKLGMPLHVAEREAVELTQTIPCVDYTTISTMRSRGSDCT